MGELLDSLWNMRKPTKVVGWKVKGVLVAVQCYGNDRIEGPTDKEVLNLYPEAIQFEINPDSNGYGFGRFVCPFVGKQIKPEFRGLYPDRDKAIDAISIDDDFLLRGAMHDAWIGKKFEPEKCVTMFLGHRI